MRIFVMLLEMSYYHLTENSVVQYNGRHRYDTDGIQEERVKCLQSWFISLPSAGEGSRGEKEIVSLYSNKTNNDQPGTTSLQNVHLFPHVVVEEPPP